MAREPFNPDLIPVPAGEPIGVGRGRLTVSQVTSLVKQAIETALPSTLHVVGEMSNFKRHSSGHLYLTLKDRFSELSCVMWRSKAAALKFTPTDGMEVVATGTIEVFERAGRYQLYIRKLEPLGVGALELAFRQLCEKLSREGLFDEEHKQPLPAYPECIALVTSPTGAAVADILRTIERRYPCVRVLIHAVRVQGAGAAEEIAAAIRRINAHMTSLGGIDLMIVGRGGGSLEDLWAFNEEIVARAIHASRIPIISAVGHEVDVTIADLAADVRAATPTSAAELAVPVLDDVLAEISAHQARLRRALLGLRELAAARITAVLQRSAFREPVGVVHRWEQLVDELTSRMHRRLTDLTHRYRRVLDRLEPIIQRITPHRVLLSRTVKVHEAEKRLRLTISRHLVSAERFLNRCTRRLERASPAHRILRHVDHVRRTADAIAAATHYRLDIRRERVRRQEERLAAMSYRSVLARGFCITRIKKGRKVVRSVSQLRDLQRLVSRIADGEFELEVVNLNQLELFE